MQFFQQHCEVGPVRRLAFDQPPGAVNRVLPVEIDAVQLVLLDDVQHRTDKYGPALWRCRRTRKTARTPTADGQQHFQLRILFTQYRQQLQIGHHFR